VYSDLSGRCKSWRAVVSNNGVASFVRQRNLLRLREMRAEMCLCVYSMCIVNDWIQASPACFSLEMMATSLIKEEEESGRGGKWG
jgi:hypothetical protein